MIRPALLGLLLLSPAAGAGDGSTAFGLNLGMELTIPLCDKQGFAYLKPVSGSCYGPFRSEATLDGHGGGGPPEQAVIVFADSDQPAIVVGNVKATLLDGKLESIEFPTAGTVAVPFVLDALREKYGKESKLENYKLRNGLGIVTDHVSAEWVGKDFVASYVELLPGSKVGRVQIDSPKGFKRRSSAVRSPKDVGTKL